MKENYIDSGTNPKRKIQKVRHAKSYPNMMAFWCAEVARVKNRKRNNSGFSLIELIIVIAIMAILAAAIAPALIRYIDRSRKSIDIANAEVLFKAAEMAATSSNDEAMEGWTEVANSTNHSLDGYAEVTENGYLASMDRTTSNKYHINVIAWARGVNYNAGGTEWQNARFKVTRDSNYQKQIVYTDEFLVCLTQDSAKGETYAKNKACKFHGFSAQSIEFKFKKSLEYGKAECWLICVNCENHTPEVWIGDKNYNNNPDHKVRPLYRLYPNPCDAYRN